MILVKLFAFIFFGIHTFLASTSPQTDFIRIDKSGLYPLISFSNSTSKVHRIGLHLDSDAFLFTITADSSFVLDSSSIVSSGSFIPFSLSGQLYLTQLNFATSNEHSVVGSLALAPPFSLGIDLTASVHLSSSSFSNLAMTNNLGTFLSSGLCASQTLHHTTFENITIHDSTEEGAVTLTDQCTLDDCVFTNCQDTFYGLIVSGMTCKTMSWFSAMNSTFTKCVRNEPLGSPVLRRVLDNGNCKKTVKDESTTTSKSYDCRQQLENTMLKSGSYTFKSCYFTGCSSPGGKSGGALYQTDGWVTNSKKIDCQNCVFTSCHADNHGGAVYSEKTKNQYLTSCNFTSNSVPHDANTPAEHNGGAVEFENTDSTLSVRGCKFNGNQAGSRGGGIRIQNLQSGQSGHLIENCEFRNNHVERWEGNTKTYQSGIGGGFEAQPNRATTFGECTFINNDVGWHGAGLVYSYSSAPSANTFNWFMFSQNKAWEGIDIYIRAPSMSRTAVDPWTFTDSLTVPPQSNRYRFNTSANEQSSSYNDNWLVVGPEVFVNNQVGSKNTSSCRHYSTNTNCATISTAVKDGRGATTLFTIKTIRISLVNTGKTYTESGVVEIGDSIVHIGPMTPSSAVTLEVTSSVKPALFTISKGIANLTGFSLTVTHSIDMPLARISDSSGQLWFYSMKISSSFSHTHSTPLFELNTGYLYVVGTTIWNFKFSDDPLLSFSTTTTKPPRFENSRFINITRNNNNGAVLSLNFNSGSRNIQVYGLYCESCSATTGNGGAVAVQFDSNSGGKILTFTSCTFDKCSAQSSNSAQKGGALYINIDDKTSTIRVISSNFTTEGTKVQGQYVHIDCKDGEYVGDANNWSGPNNIGAGLAETDRPYYWLNDTTRSISRSLYYFLFAPTDRMIVDQTKGADIRTCGWPDSEKQISCKTLKVAFDKRTAGKSIELTPISTPYTTGTEPFVVTSTLNIKPTKLETSPTPTITIDNWSSASPIFQIRTGTTTFQNVDITLGKTITAQFAYLTDADQASLEMNHVKITAANQATTSNYFLHGTPGSITLTDVNVTDFTLSNNCFVGVSTSSSKSTLTIKQSKFTNVISQKGKGSVISLSKSCYCDITLNDVTFKGCISSTTYGAIYDDHALTENPASTFTFTTVKFEKDASELTKQYAYFDEPGTYLFGKSTDALFDPKLWRALIPDGTTDEYLTYYQAKASGSGNSIEEPAQPFSLLHILSTPKDKNQNALHVAGKVGDVPQYLNVDNYKYQGCGWNDLPCMTIGQAAAQLSATTSTIQLLASHTHVPETKAVTFNSASRSAFTFSIKSSTTTSVIKPVTPDTSITSLFTIKGDSVTFELIQFLLSAPEGQTEATIGFNLITVESGALALESTSFVSQSDKITRSKPLILLDMDTDPLTISSTQFPTIPSTEDPPTQGGYISAVSTDGTVYRVTADGNNLYHYFTASDANNNTLCGFYRHTERSTGNTASLLHWVYQPAEAHAEKMHVNPSTGKSKTVTTCGWSDLPCKTLDDALYLRTDTPVNPSYTVPTIQFDSDYELDTCISLPAVATLTLEGKPDADKNDEKKLTAFDLTTTTTTSETQTAVISNVGTLTIASLAFKISAPTLPSLLAAILTSSGTLTFKDMTCASGLSAAHPYSIITITGGSFTITNSVIDSFKLSTPFVQITGSSSIVISATKMQSITIPSEESKALPSLIHTDSTSSVSLTLSNDTFAQCQSPSSQTGGAIYFYFKDKDTQFTLDSSTIQGCSCNTDTGKGGFLYVDVPDSNTDALPFSIRTVTCGTDENANTASEYGGAGIFVNCKSLEQSLHTNMFSLYLNPDSSKGEVRTSSYYSFWGARYGGTPLSDGEHAPDDNTIIDLLAFFDQYSSAEIYVSTTTDVEEKECGSEDHPCTSIHSGASHVLPSADSHIYLKTAGCQISAATNLGGYGSKLTLSAQNPVQESKYTLTVEVSVPKLTITGLVDVLYLSFALHTEGASDKVLFDVQPASTLTLKGSEFTTTTISYTVISLTNATLVLDTVTFTGVTSSTNSFITASGSSGGDDIQLTGCLFTNFVSTAPLLTTTDGASLSCVDTTFDYTTACTIGTLFNLAGDSEIKNTIIKVTETSVTLSADLIISTASITLTTDEDKKTTDRRTTISGLKLATYKLVSGSGRITISRSTLKGLDHSTANAVPLFANDLTVDDCTFDSIQQTSDSVAALLDLTSASSISSSKFSFTDDNMQNLMTIEGGGEIRSCSFEPASGVNSIEIKNTLISVSEAEQVTFESCNFTNISSTDVSKAVITSQNAKVVLNKVEFTFTSTATQLGTFVSVSESTLELLDCSYGLLKSVGARSNTNSPTLKNDLFVATTSVTMNGTTVSFVNVTDGKYLIKSNSVIIGTGCEFHSLSATGTTNPILFHAQNPATLTITGDDFTFDDVYLFAVQAFTEPTTIANCTFELADGKSLSKSLITVSAATTFTGCQFKRITSAQPVIKAENTQNITVMNTDVTSALDCPTFISTDGAVTMTGCTFDVSGKLSNLISAASVQVEGTKFKNFDHSSNNAAPLFNQTFTIAGCTFASITPSSSLDYPLLEPSSGAITVSDTAFTFTSGYMKNLMKINEGSDIRNCSFAATPANEPNSDSIEISDTLITIAEGTIPVTFELCNFTKISSTHATNAVIASACGIIFDRVIFSYKGTSKESPAALNAFATTSRSFEFKDCFFGPYTKAPEDAEEEPSDPDGSRHQSNDDTIQEPLATLNSAFITLEKGATLTLTNTVITDIVITGRQSCLITTPSAPDGEVQDAEKITIVIDSCSFKNVVQSDKENQEPNIPIFNTPAVNTFTINNCAFDALTQSKKSYLLSAPTATSFTITNTNFYLPETVRGSILDVTQTVTFSGCHFLKSSTVTEEVTTVEAPLIHVNGRSDLSLVDCSFSKLTANGVPAVVDLGDSITLTARNCSFKTVSSDIKIGQVFNAKASATFEECTFSFDDTYTPDTSTEVCSWNASILQLSGGDFSLTNTVFHNISEGALGISGGAHVRIGTWDFDNKVVVSLHPKKDKAYVVDMQMQRNINCTEASSLTIIDESIKDTTSLYIVTDTCDVTYTDGKSKDKEGKLVEKTPNSTFFIPTLSNAEGDCPDFSTLSLTFTGTDLIPCNLNFEIFLDGEDTPSFTGPMSGNKSTDDDDDDDDDDESTDTDVDAASLVRSNTGEDTTGPKEVTFKTDVDLSNTPEVYSRIATGVRLSYGEGEDRKTTKTNFNPTIRFPSQREAQGGTAEPEEEDKMAWWYYLIIGGGALLLLLIIILVICCCCCQDEEKEDDEDEEEEDIKALNTDALLSLNTKDLLPTAAFKDFDANKVVTVEGMHTVAPYDKTVISAKRSIYYQIHNPAHRQDHNPFNWTATIAYHLCNGVQHILDTLYADQPTGANEVTTDVMKNILNTLCPHCIFAGERDSIVLGSVPDSYQVPVSANAKEGKTDFIFECQRYRSPELTAHPNDDTRAMKESNAVFAIGLIMYEVFTGWLVFDGYPHSRVVEMVSQGARPDLVLVRSVDPNFASILESATAMEAEQRPTIAQLLDKIDMYLPNDLRKGGTQHRVTASMIDDDDL